MTQDIIRMIAAKLGKLVESEGEANADYNEIISLLEKKLADSPHSTEAPELRAMIDELDEILSDEINHAIKLLAMQKKLTGLAPSSDALRTALAVLRAKDGSEGLEWKKVGA